MAAPDHYNATIAEVLRTPLPDAILSRITGNAPQKVKEWTVSLDPDPLENGKILTLVCESDVTEGMVDGQDQVHNAFVITVIDECVSSAVTALKCAEGGPGISGVSLTLDTVFHNPARRGARLRFVNTTLAAVGGMTSCRCQVWDLTQRRLVATSTFVGMRSSLPKVPAAARL
ncbi:hypothetical protein B0H14DRAFT_2880840 [Mycena olivaceomarginata]|nr:hypothetical protein B0H14DRAFT_2880840 [Mycena olivaceomarginata]